MKANPLRAKSDFICRYKCTNNLPDVPQEPKILQYPFDPMRYIRRGPTGSALEKAYSQSQPILAEPDLGVPIDLIDPGQYTVTGQEPALNAADLELIEGQKSLEEEKEVRGAPMPWFLATYYVDPLAAKEARGEIGAMAMPGEDFTAVDAVTAKSEDSIDSRINVIEDTFADAAQMAARTLKHPTKKGVVAVEVTPLLPDVERWGTDTVHFAFDEPPPTALPERQAKDGSQIVAGGRPIIQGLSSENEMWMAYLVPTDKRKAAEAELEAEAEGAEGAEENPTEYRRLRSYTFTNVADTDEKKREAGKTNSIYRDGDGPYLYKNMVNYFRLKKRVRTDDTDVEAADRDSLLVTRHDPTEADIDEAAGKRAEIDDEGDDDEGDDFGEIGEDNGEAGEDGETTPVPLDSVQEDEEGAGTQVVGDDADDL